MDSQSCTLPVAPSTKLGTFWRSIKGKMFLVFVAAFVSVLALALLNYWSLDMVKERLLLLERYEDLLNNILEVRRFEKNYLLYEDASSLQEGIDYLGRIAMLVEELQPDMREVVGKQQFEQVKNICAEYRQIIEAAKGEKTPNRTEQARIRELGKQMVEAAEAMLNTKRQRIHKAIVRTSLIPFISIVVFILVMVLVMKLIAVGLLKPLGIVRQTTQRVARGDFRPIPLKEREIEEISGLIGAFNRMAYELETNQEDLLQARKIAALGTFTAGIAHELNNPINNISLTAETLNDLYADELDADAGEMIQDIILQTERASDIVRNLLDFSRTEQPAFKHLALREVLQSTVKLVKNQLLMAGVSLDVSIPEDLPRVDGNMQNLQQVFMNLLINAIQAMPEGGNIGIRAASEPQGAVRIDISDTGVGIDPQKQQHIFEPFFTTKEVGKGTGLGLSVTYSIVKRHGGRMEVKSEPGQGSVFSVFLPVDREKTASDGTAP